MNTSNENFIIGISSLFLFAIAVICRIPGCDKCKKDPNTGKEICEECESGYRLKKNKCEGEKITTDTYYILWIFGILYSSN